MAELEAVQYEPLQSTAPPSKSPLRQPYIKWLILFGWAILVLLFGVFFQWMAATLVLFLASVPLIIAVLMLYTHPNYTKSWKAFAQVNGWQLARHIHAAKIVPPRLQRKNFLQRFSPVIYANVDGVSCDLFMYYAAPDQIHLHQARYFVIATVVLPKTLPHIYLHSRRRKQQLDEDMLAGRQLQLEGNFGDYFTLSIEAGEQIDVLSILTPDVMSTLISYSTAQDIEIFGNRLYFLSDDIIVKPEVVEELLRSVATLVPDITQNIQAVNLGSSQH